MSGRPREVPFYASNVRVGRRSSGFRNGVCPTGARTGGLSTGFPRLLLLPALLLFLLALPARAYLYQQYGAVDRPVNNLRVADLALPGTMRVAWDYVPLGADPVYEVQRRLSGGTWESLGETLNTYYDDSAFTWSTPYEYRVRVVYDVEPSAGLPAPPPGANPADILGLRYASGQPWRAISATPHQVVDSENQAADSRYDLRYSYPLFLDYPFGTTTYRGGLWAGWAADPSRIGRSFMKLPLPALPTGETLWVGWVNGYHTRSAATGTTTVGCHSVSTGWNWDTLKWSTAPSLNPLTPTATAAVTWDAANPVASWKRWNMGPAAAPLMGGTLGVGLASTSESTAGWAYFAKREYDYALAPRMLLAHGSPVELMSLSVTPPVVEGSIPAFGTVTLTATAPPGGKVVNLTSWSPFVASVPAQVTIPAGAFSTTFTITTYAVMSSELVYLDAALADAPTDIEWGYLEVIP